MQCHESQWRRFPRPFDFPFRLVPWLATFANSNQIHVQQIAVFHILSYWDKNQSPPQSPYTFRLLFSSYSLSLRPLDPFGPLAACPPVDDPHRDFNWNPSREQALATGSTLGSSFQRQFQFRNLCDFGMISGCCH